MVDVHSFGERGGLCLFRRRKEKAKKMETSVERRGEREKHTREEEHRPRAKNSLERVSRHNLDKSLIPGIQLFLFEKRRKSWENGHHSSGRALNHVPPIYHTAQSLLECSLHFHYWQQTFILSSRLRFYRYHTEGDKTGWGGIRPRITTEILWKFVVI